MMGHPAARAIVALLLAAAAGLASGCAAPTLPLPPPQVEPLEAPDGEGLVTVRGTVHELALVMVLNEDLEEGVIATADEGGAFEVRIAAESGHTITVWQRRGTDESPPVGQTVP
ncbi:MAG: hypothetical protein ACODAU_09865 [Myxococcota bacterium]